MGEDIKNQYPADQYNLLVPTQMIQQVTPWHVTRFSLVQADLGDDSGDIFKVGCKVEGKSFIDLFTPAKPLLMRISTAAGIAWDPVNCGPVGAPTRDYVCYKAVGAIRLPDGSWIPLEAMKEIDLSVIEEELREQAAKKANGPLGKEVQNLGFKGKWEKYPSKYNGKEEEKNGYFLDESEKPRYIEHTINQSIIQWRKNKLARAETGAKLRLIRMAVGLKSQYTMEELKKPFVVPCISFEPDYSDPAVKQMILANGFQAMNSMFPGTKLPMMRPALVAKEEGEEIIDAEITHPSPSVTADATPIQEENIPTASEEVGQDPGTDNGDLKCSDCGENISQKVFDYSKSHKSFKRPLCYTCQDKVRNAGKQVSA